MRLWTKKARKDANLGKFSTPFGARCMCYYYIRKQCKEDPSEIRTSYDGLRKAAREAQKRKHTSVDDDSDAECGDWFNRAVAVSRAYVT